jgi:hypothetical protein
VKPAAMIAEAMARFTLVPQSSPKRPQSAWRLAELC